MRGGTGLFCLALVLAVAEEVVLVGIDIVLRTGRAWGDQGERERRREQESVGRRKTVERGREAGP